jgi:hypothetical protein
MLCLYNRAENVKSLIEYVVERFEEDLKQSGHTQVLQVCNEFFTQTHTCACTYIYMHCSLLQYQVLSNTSA